MSGLLDAVDALNEARCLFAAAHMAVESIGKTGLGVDVEAKALDAVLYAASRKFETGIDLVEQERLGKKAVRS